MWKESIDPFYGKAQLGTVLVLWSAGTRYVGLNVEVD